MQTQTELIDSIVEILSQEESIDRVLFYASYLVNGMPYEVNLIIFESDTPDHIISMYKYEQLLAKTFQGIKFNLLPIATELSNATLEYRLKDILCIYTKKEVE